MDILLNNQLVFSASIKTFLENAQKTFTSWGTPILGVMGVLLLIYSAYRLWRYFTSKNPDAQFPLVRTIIGLIVGGFFTAQGAFKTWQNLAAHGKDTIDNINNGTGGAIIIDKTIEIK